MMGCFLLSFLLSFLPSLRPSSLPLSFTFILKCLFPLLVLSSIPSVLPPLVFLSLCPFFYSFPPLFFSQTLNYSFPSFLPSLLPSLRPLPCIAFSSCPRPSLICVFSPFPSVFKFLPPSVPLHFPFLAHTLVCFFLFSCFSPIFLFPSSHFFSLLYLFPPRFSLSPRP